jgi:hypothetical protein
MSTEKALAATLGITPTKVIDNQNSKEIVEVIQSETGKDQEDDYNLTRNTLRNLIRKGDLAMEDMARESESPRAYEVLSTMMKTVADMTTQLYDIQKKKKDLLAEKGRPAQDNITVEKAVFVGNPAELLKKMKENKE